MEAAGDTGGWGETGRRRQETSCHVLPLADRSEEHVVFSSHEPETESKLSPGSMQG